MKERLIIVGANTTAKQVYDFVEEYNLYEVVGFAVDSQYKNSDSFCGLPIFELETLESVMDVKACKVFVAILWNRLNADRRQIYERLRKRGFQFANLISPSAKIRGRILGNNCWIHDYAVIQSDAEVGENCMIMAHSLIGAFSKVSAHCFLGTKSTVAGECEIGEQTFIGINCTVFDAVRVGEKCILGACTAVKRNLENCTIVKTLSDGNVIKKVDKEIIEDKLLFSLNVR